MSDALMTSGQNLSTGERALSAVAGLVLAATAAKPRPNHLLSLIVLIAGVGLAAQAASGYSPFKGSSQS